MELTGERLIPAPLLATWAALNDPEILKQCIAGCESLERTEPDAFGAMVAVKVGPVNARFRGTLKMTNVHAPHTYTINFDGQGGVAGFGKGSADVALSEEGKDQTRLRYAAQAQVGGKMAQVGARLIDAAAGKIAEDFFAAFDARLRPAQAPAAEPAVPEEVASAASAASKTWMWIAVGAAVLIALLFWLTR